MRSDPIDIELRAAIDSRRKVKRLQEPADPKAVERHKRLEEIEERRRLKEQTDDLL